MPRRRTLLLAAPAILALRPAGAQTPAWPERPISMIVAFPAGGGTDVAARLLAKVMERILG
ncbi:MAG: tripartite tricarboxylate transporter substrate binding protein, partial [Acetobacteraceae bacterium]|nr:tripartite tricarboxylate transporter substrate binding protein [Acetobacteraceae bacterium]